MYTAKDCQRQNLHSDATMPVSRSTCEEGLFRCVVMKLGTAHYIYADARRLSSQRSRSNLYFQ